MKIINIINNNLLFTSVSVERVLYDERFFSPPVQSKVKCLPITTIHAYRPLLVVVVIEMIYYYSDISYVSLCVVCLCVCVGSYTHDPGRVSYRQDPAAPIYTTYRTGIPETPLESALRGA